MGIEPITENVARDASFPGLQNEIAYSAIKELAYPDDHGNGGCRIVPMKQRKATITCRLISRLWLSNFLNQRSIYCIRIGQRDATLMPVRRETRGHLQAQKKKKMWFPDNRHGSQNP